MTGKAKPKTEIHADAGSYAPGERTCYHVLRPSGHYEERTVYGYRGRPRPSIDDLLAFLRGWGRRKREE